MYLASALLGCAVGAVGTAMGGILAILVGKRSHLPQQLMAFAGGLMVAVVFFDMLPQSSRLGGVVTMGVGAAFGGVFMALFTPVFTRGEHHSMAQTGFLVLIGIALHNLPEGLAVGSSLAENQQFALSLSLLIMVHNIPEGLAVCLPLRLSGMSAAKVLLLSLLTGLPTAVGALIGTAVGNISAGMIAACLSFAGGAMLYISLKELIPATKKSAFPALVGLSAGVIIITLI